jgi:hypothetical protein
MSEAVLVDIGVAMGPVIASIHEKRSQLRAEIREAGELAEEPRRLDGGARRRPSPAPRGSHPAPRSPCCRRARRPAPCRAPAAALPAERRDRGLDEVDRADLAGKVGGDADRDAGAAVVDGDQRRDARAELLLHRIDSPAGPWDRAPRPPGRGTCGPPTSPGPRLGPAAAAQRQLPSSRRPARARACGVPRPARRRARALVGRGLEAGGDGAQAACRGRSATGARLAGQRLDPANADWRRRFRRRS